MKPLKPKDNQLFLKKLKKEVKKKYEQKNILMHVSRSKHGNHLLRRSSSRQRQ
jgi:hypothetical protein